MIPLLALTLFSAGLAMAPEPTTASTQPASPEQVLEHSGKRNVNLHDPSTLIKDGDTYWLFSTGVGVNAFRSRDLAHWERGPRVFPTDGRIPKRTIRTSSKTCFWRC